MGTTQLAPLRRSCAVPHSPDDPDGVTPIPRDPDYEWCAICRFPATPQRPCPHTTQLREAC
jgi:hypothetical protein